MEKGINREHALKCVGEGWASLINKLYDAKPENTVVTQVKEKWGGLRFYTAYSTEEFDNLIDKCEINSEHICEYCGKSGKIRKLSWIKTLCEDCYKETLEYQKINNS